MNNSNQQQSDAPIIWVNELGKIASKYGTCFICVNLILVMNFILIIVAFLYYLGALLNNYRALSFKDIPVEALTSFSSGIISISLLIVLLLVFIKGFHLIPNSINTINFDVYKYFLMAINLALIFYLDLLEGCATVLQQLLI